VSSASVVVIAMASRILPQPPMAMEARYQRFTRAINDEIVIGN
jgi:hypothetical protein